MSISNEEAYYEQADLWDAERFLDGLLLRRFVTIAEMIPSDVDSLLDVGTAIGAFLRVLEDRQSPLRLNGLERSSAAIEKAVCRARIYQGSADDLPFEADSFDMVSAQEVIEHFPYGVYERALSEMERVARRYILLSVPYKEDRVNVRCPYCQCEFHHYCHMRSFDEAVLARLWNSFELVSTTKITIMAPVAPLPMRLISRFCRALGWRSATDPFAMCPQCGYKQQDRLLASKASTDELESKVRRLYPKREVPLWIVALYRRKGALP